MKTLFVDIDTQVDFIMPEGNLYVPGAEKLIPNFQRLLEIAIRRRVPILSSADSHAPDDPEFDIFPPHCVKVAKGGKRLLRLCLMTDHMLKIRRVL